MLYYLSNNDIKNTAMMGRLDGHVSSHDGYTRQAFMGIPNLLVLEVGYMRMPGTSERQQDAGIFRVL